MRMPFSSPAEILHARYAWTHAVLISEVATARERGYLTGDLLPEVPDPAALLAELAARLEVTPPGWSPMARVQAGFDLGAIEEDVLWLLACCELDPRLARMAELLASSGMHQLSVQHVQRLVGAGTRDLERLEQHGLIEIQLDPSLPMHRRKIRIDDRVLELVRAHERTPTCAAALPSSMKPFAQVRVAARRMDELAIPPAVISAAEAAMRATRAVVVASGMPGLGRRTLLAAAASAAGLAVLEVRAAKLAKELPALKPQLRQLARECRLGVCVPLIIGIDALTADAIELMGVELIERLDGLVMATSGIEQPALRWDRPTIAIELTSPTSGQRATLWRVALGQGSEADGEHLAGQYPLAPALIHRAAEAAKVRIGRSERSLMPDDIYAGIRTVLDDKLGQFAKRVTVTQRWDDLVLPQDQVDTILELMARIRQRRKVYEQWGFAAKVGKGLGVGALFSGPPGTGKTMVAALIARDLGLELYQVDLAKLVSKWVGETEKQLAALFDAAEAGHAILLFDEADSLFGKRTDVKSSNDRYANLETNYLLQRLESYTGICLLTSNHESNIDPAFQRRLSLHLRFRVPEIDERAQLWRAMLPAAAPVASDVPFAELAKRYAMSGGYIRNAALRAAFLAADEDSPITLAHLEQAARAEYEGMGKIVMT
ncbi:MAG: ATP-binding protein [Deltaproteobacteria bacterium]|nr:ATP-binding protein [Deltaproteobacteria bacterium]